MKLINQFAQTRQLAWEKTTRIKILATPLDQETGKHLIPREKLRPINSTFHWIAHRS